MKKTLNVNIGSVAFTIDEDAYYALKGYFDDIRSRLYESDRQEIMEDVESRTADIFRENLSFDHQVVSLDLVKKTMAIIGSAQTFGEKKYDPDYEDAIPGAGPIPVGRRLYRSRTDKVLGGVCGGVAEYFGIDPSLVRIVAFVLVFFASLGFWVYLAMWIFVPIEPVTAYFEKTSNKKRRGI